MFCKNYFLLYITYSTHSFSGFESIPLSAERDIIQNVQSTKAGGDTAQAECHRGDYPVKLLREARKREECWRGAELLRE